MASSMSFDTDNPEKLPVATRTGVLPAIGIPGAAVFAKWLPTPQMEACPATDWTAPDWNGLEETATTRSSVRTGT
jgi:hypothetical protein